MKKLFLLFALVGMNVLAYSQDVKVNINNQDATVKDDCPYRINGICVTEDIGGVDANFIETCISCSNYYPGLALHNYNSFPVNVLWSVEYNGEIKNGVTILGVEGDKIIDLPRGVNPRNFSLKGLIVRKLAQ